MKIAIIGYGKMGKEIELLALKKNHEVVCIIDNEQDWKDKSDELKTADLAIEFTQPHIAVDNINKCFDIHLPVVCGTTGWFENLPSLNDRIIEENQSLVYASNFSIGVNIFFKVNEYLAKLMNPHTIYEVEIEEIHHTQKLDAPSGTAISLANQIIENLDRKTHWKKEQEEVISDLAIKSLRFNEVTGIHSVNYNCEIDSITIKHEAFNRKGFAAGAMFAAEWLLHKSGCFDFKDILFNKV